MSLRLSLGHDRWHSGFRKKVRSSLNSVIKIILIIPILLLFLKKSMSLLSRRRIKRMINAGDVIIVVHLDENSKFTSIYALEHKIKLTEKFASSLR